MSKYVEVKLNIIPSQRKSIATALQNNSSVRLRFTYKQLMENNVTLYVTPTQYKRIQKQIGLKKGIMITFSNKQLQAMKSGGILGPILGALVGSLAPMLFQKIFPDKEGSGIKKTKVKKSQNDDDNMTGEGRWDPLTMAIARQSFVSNGKPVPPQLQGNFLPDGNGINIPNGYGINIPNGYGINIPGSGINMPGAGINMPGGGINIPGAGINMPNGTGLYLPPYSNNQNVGTIIPANGEATNYHLAGNHTSYLPDAYMNAYHNYKPLPQKNVKRGKGLSDAYLNPQSEKFQMLK